MSKPVENWNQSVMVKKFKLHLAVNILPQAIYITKTDATDRNDAIEMFIATSNNFGRVQNMLVGYSVVCRCCKKILGCSVQVVKKSDLHSFKVKALDS